MPSAANVFRVGTVVAYHNLPKIGRKWRDSVEGVSYQTAKAIAERAQDLAPMGDRSYVDKEGESHPGWLKESIVYHRAPGARLQWQVEVLARYGMPVEFGYHEWRSGTWVPPQPYFTPAVEEQSQKFFDDVNFMIDGIARKTARVRSGHNLTIGQDGRFSGQFVESRSNL